MRNWQELASLVAQKIEAEAIKGEPKELYEPISYTLAMGGKRIRPVLVLMAAELFGKEIDQAWPIAKAIEIFHNFTLVHDDIMDEAPIRRGKSTVHEKWNRDIAILSGDVMFVKAYQELCLAETKQLTKLLSLFNQTAIEVCEGQQMDMNFEQEEELELIDYLQMIKLKTAVLLAASLKLGAIAADAEPLQANLLYDFGLNLGLAFQIQDDYLDAFADPQKFGKKVGGDIVANKKTYLLLAALESNDETLKAALKKAMQIEEETIKIKEVKKLFEALGAEQKAKQAIKHYSDRAMIALSQIDRPEETKKPLQELATYLMQRGV